MSRYFSIMLAKARGISRLGEVLSRGSKLVYIYMMTRYEPRAWISAVNQTSLVPEFRSRGSNTPS